MNEIPKYFCHRRESNKKKESHWSFQVTFTKIRAVIIIELSDSNSKLVQVGWPNGQKKKEIVLSCFKSTTLNLRFIRKLLKQL